MTYARKFGKVGIYTDGVIYKWFKDTGNALAYWREHFDNDECSEEWLDEYETVELKNMVTGEVIASL